MRHVCNAVLLGVLVLTPRLARANDPAPEPTPQPALSAPAPANSGQAPALAPAPAPSGQAPAPAPALAPPSAPASPSGQAPALAPAPAPAPSGQAPAPASAPAPEAPLPPDDTSAEPRPSLRWNPHPDTAPVPPPETVSGDAPVSFDSNGAPLRIRLSRVARTPDGGAVLGPPRAQAPGELACTTPCSLTVALGTYMLHTEGDGLRTYDGPLEVRPNGFKMTLGAGRKKDFAWGLGLMGIAAAGIVAWSAVYVPQLADGASDPYGNAAFTGTLVGVGVIAIAGFTVGGFLLKKSARGPLAIRPGLDRSPTTSAFASPLSLTF